MYFAQANTSRFEIKIELADDFEAAISFNWLMKLTRKDAMAAVSTEHEAGRRINSTNMRVRSLSLLFCAIQTSEKRDLMKQIQ